MKWLLPAGFAVALAAFVFIIPHAPAEYAIDRVQPLVVVTYWQQYGAALAGWLLLGLGVSGVGYWGWLRYLSRPSIPQDDTLPQDDTRIPHHDTVRVAAMCALCCAIALASPVIFSSDVYAYAGYGAMLAHGINPYAHEIISLRDPLLDAVQWQWGNPPPVCVYGPAFLLLAWVAAAFQPLATAAPLWFLRIAACAALIACARVRGAAILVLNPLAIWACAEGHNDVFAIAALLGGGALMRRHAFAGAALAALAGTIKAPALAGAAALTVWRAADRRKRTALLFGLLAGTALTALASLPLLFGVLHALAPAGRYAPHFSLEFLFGQFAPRGVAFALTLCAAAAIAIAGRMKTGYAAFALWMCVPNPYPWYGLWLLAIVAFCETRGERTALILAAMLGALRYIGEASSALPAALESGIVVAAYGIPAVILIMASDIARACFRRPASDTAALGPAPRRLP